MHEYCLCGGFFQPEPDPDDPGAGGVRGPGAASTSGGGNGHNRYGGQGRERRAEGFGSRVGDDEVTPLERMPTTWQVERRRRRALEAAREERLQRLRQGVCGYAAVLIWRIWEAFTGRDSVDNELLPSEYFSEEDAQLTPVQMGVARKAAKRVGLWEGFDFFTREDLLNFLRLLGHCPDEMRLQSAIDDMHMAARDNFTFGEGLHVWKHFLDTKDDELTMLKRAFQFFDRDSSGTISQAEMMETNSELEDPLTAQEIQMFFQILDTGGDGVLQYEEFFGIIGTDYEELNQRILLPANSMAIPAEMLPPDSEDDSDTEEPFTGSAARRKLIYQPTFRERDVSTRSLSMRSFHGSDDGLADFEPRDPITPRTTNNGSGNRLSGAKERSVVFSDKSLYAGEEHRDILVPGSVGDRP